MSEQMRKIAVFVHWAPEAAKTGERFLSSIYEEDIKEKLHGVQVI